MLGGNLEAKPHRYDFDIQRFYKNGIITINLSTNSHHEIFMLNPHVSSIVVENLENYKINQSDGHIPAIQLNKNVLEMPSQSWVSVIAA